MSIRAYTGKKGTTYQVRVEGPKDAFGRRRQIPVGTFATRKAAEIAEKQAELDVLTGKHLQDAGGTVWAAFEAWMRRRTVAGILQPQSVYRYTKAVRSVYGPILETPVMRVKPAMVEACHEAALARGLTSSVEVAFIRLRSCCRELAADGTLGHDPMARLRRPHVPAPRGTAWTDEQVALFLADQEAEPFYFPLWFFLLETGVRKGELRALRWKSLDLDAGVVRIEATIAEAVRPSGSKYERVSERTKTGGWRALDLSPALVDVLRQHRRNLEDEARFLRVPFRKDGYVWPRGNRQGWLGKHTIDDRLKKICARLRLPVLTPHGFRHTNISRALGHGHSMAAVQERVGHKRLETTGRYAHGAASERKRIADDLGAAFRPRRQASE